MACKWGQKYKGKKNSPHQQMHEWEVLWQWTRSCTSLIMQAAFAGSRPCAFSEVSIWWWAKADYIYILIASTEPYTTPQFNTLFLLTPTRGPCTDTEWHVSLNVSALFTAMSKLTVHSYSVTLRTSASSPRHCTGLALWVQPPGLLGSAAL